MRRFWSLALAILILLTSLAAAEPLTASTAGSNAQFSASFSGSPKATQGSVSAMTESDAAERQDTSLDEAEASAAETQQPVAPSFPVYQPSISDLLLNQAFNLLGNRELSLSWEDVRNAYRMELTLHRTDASQLEFLYTSSEGDALRVAIDAEGVTAEADGSSMHYGFDELLEVLAFELGLDELKSEDGGLQGLLEILPGLAPSAADEAFLMQLLEIATDELANAGLDFEPLYTDDGAYLHLEFSPKMLCNALVRFVDRVLECEDAVDALLSNYDAPLRALLPKLYKIYNPATGQYVQRTAYTCAELKLLWQYARQELLCQWTDNAGATLEIYEDGTGMVRQNLQIRDLPNGGSTVLLLDIDADGNASGTLTLAQNNYNSGSFETVSQVFDIEAFFIGSGMLLRVTPRTPIEDFSLLTANLLFGRNGANINLTTDLLRLRLQTDSDGLQGSLELDGEFSADLNLTIGYNVHGSLILCEGRNSYVLRLNE